MSNSKIIKKLFKYLFKIFNLSTESRSRSRPLSRSLFRSSSLRLRLLSTDVGGGKFGRLNSGGGRGKGVLAT